MKSFFFFVPFSGGASQGIILSVTERHTQERPLKEIPHPPWETLKSHAWYNYYFRHHLLSTEQTRSNKMAKVHRVWSLTSQRFLELQINTSNTGNQASSNWQVFSFPFISFNLSNPHSIYWLNAAVAKRNEGKIPLNQFSLVNPHLTTPWKSWRRVRLSHSKSQACSLILVLLKLPFVTFNLSCTRPRPH